MPASPRLASLLLALLCAPAASALAQTLVYDGSTHHTNVAIPRIDADIRVDGVLDEDAWSRAARLTGFTQYRPVDSRPAEDSTEVRVFYSANAIHFGIRAWESHGDVVRATLADRDNIAADDRIQILLDTYDDNRRALLFAVNPLGVQQDGVQSEGFDPSQSAGGRFDGIVDISPDFNFESRGHVTPWGYEVEIRIPFKSLRYQSADPQQWGLQITRVTQHSGHEDTWAPAVRANASFLVQSGRLSGLTGLHRGTVVDIDPELTSSVSGTPRDDAWHYESPSARLGGNVRWGITPNYTMNATVRPDFSQVEADVSQVTVNERFALFFPEKRPFFLEGLEQYDTPNRLIYTRQIHAPIGGVKLTGKSGGTAIAYLGAADDRLYSFDGDRVPVFNLLRIRRDIGTSSTLGIVHTDRVEGRDYNRVSGADARVVWRKIWYSQAQLAEAWTRDPAGSRRGELWDVTLADRTGRNYGNHFEVEGIAPGFVTRSGFVPRTGIVSGRFANRFSIYGRPGSLLEQLSTFIVASPVWLYDEFPRSASFEGSYSENFQASLRGGWQLRANVANGYERFEDEAYAGYRVNRGADTIALARPHGIYGLWSGSIGATTPNRALTLSADLGTGAGVIFAEAAEGRVSQATVTASWHPNASLRVESSLVSQRIARARDGSRFSTATIPRIKTEYQLTRAIFLRYIGQYVAQDRTALVDPGSGLPLIASSYGTARFGPSAALLVNDFRNDFLFSYKPTPGTVFFLGYGASLTEPEAFSFRTGQLRRVSDGFFLKASYRYRL
ncbi:MAG: carbohydrate binding family 9 domain-containing protein [Gemmatimonadaceae bacterium]|nr:carbohydrate binding family 9 domain-containing protein [Gemmatimonadaceae bacterium]NUQ92667.1 carbohydrate binding family 9 domain-containing protein [Gemmatimonadaceae bacterium]NUS98727.1 carbohydrate binding family 9 domain-containing protein [Gemmatimonadaceae bacterium]